MKALRNLFYTILILGLLSSCFRKELRGKVEHSQDKKTYLVIEDNNGGGCGDLLVDGKRWPYKISEKGIIEPGNHTIKCGTELSIYIKEGTIFHFDYWGP